MLNLAETLRKRLDDAGVRELVEYGKESVEERAMLYGCCPLCRAVMNTRFRISLDEYDHVHASLDSICNCVGTE